MHHVVINNPNVQPLLIHFQSFIVSLLEVVSVSESRITVGIVGGKLYRTLAGSSGILVALQPNVSETDVRVYAVEVRVTGLDRYDFFVSRQRLLIALQLVISPAEVVIGACRIGLDVNRVLVGQDSFVVASEVEIGATNRDTKLNISRLELYELI